MSRPAVRQALHHRSVAMPCYSCINKQFKPNSNVTKKTKPAKKEQAK
jgi:hypothetical protein